jgi:hypothetical protein
MWIDDVSFSDMAYGLDRLRADVSCHVHVGDVTQMSSASLVSHGRFGFGFGILESEHQLQMIESIYILDTASAALILQHTYTGRPPPSTLL